MQRFRRTAAAPSTGTGTPRPEGVATARGAGRRAWTVTALLFGFLLLNFADKAALGFAGVHIQRDLGIGPAEFGLLQSSFFWLFAAGALLIGAFSSRIRARWLLAGLMLTWVATMVPLLGTAAFWVVLLCRVLLGFAEGPAFALANHTVHSWFPAHRRAMPAGIVTAGASVGPLIAAPVLSWVIVTWSWHASFGVLIVCGLVWTVAWLLVARHDPPRSAAPPAGDGEDGADGADGDPTLVLASYRTLVTTGTVIGIALLAFFSYWSTSLKLAWLPVYLSDGLGFDTVTAGQLITFPYAVAAATAIGSGWLSNRLIAHGFSRRVSRGLLAGGLVVGSGASMVGFTLVGAGALQVVFIALAFSLNSAAFAVAFIAVADIVHPSRRGPVLGGIVAFYSLAGIVAPYLFGVLVAGAADPVDGYGNGFALTGTLMVVGGVLATLMIRPERDAERIRARTLAAAGPVDSR